MLGLVVTNFLAFLQFPVFRLCPWDVVVIFVCTAAVRCHLRDRGNKYMYFVAMNDQKH